MKMRKMLALLLALAMAFTSLLAFTSCQGGGGGDDDDEVAPEDLSPTYEGEAKRFKGSFNVLTRVDGEKGSYGNVHDLVAESNLGDQAIIKAVRERNQRIESNFGVKIKRTKQEDPAAAANTAIKGNSTTYDAFMIAVQSALPIALNGGILNLDQATYMDVYADWWDKGVTENLTLAQGVYIAIGDLQTGDKNSTYLTLFNESLLGTRGTLTLDAEKLYKQVTDGIGQEGGLTMELLTQYATLYSTPSTDNTKPMFDPLFQGRGNYGLYTQSDIATVILLCGGFTPTKKDDKELSGLKNNVNSDFENAANEVWEYFGKYTRETWFINLDNYQTQYDNFWEECARGSFKANRATFFMCHANTVDLIRDMDEDYGVLPIPKLYDTQTEYASTLQYMNCPCYMVPNRRNDTLNDKSSYILEAMSYYSSVEYGAEESLNYNYYYRVLRAKGLRDPNAWKMLDLIFESRVYDLVLAINIGGVKSGIQNASVGYDRTTFSASTYRELDIQINDKLKTLMGANNA